MSSIDVQMPLSRSSSSESVEYTMSEEGGIVASSSSSSLMALATSALATLATSEDSTPKFPPGVSDRWTKDIFVFLNKIRDSGVRNMFMESEGNVRDVIRKFNIPRMHAETLMREYCDYHDYDLLDTFYKSSAASAAAPGAAPSAAPGAAPGAASASASGAASASASGAASASATGAASAAATGAASAAASGAASGAASAAASSGAFGGVEIIEDSPSSSSSVSEDGIRAFSDLSVPEMIELFLGGHIPEMDAEEEWEKLKECIMKRCKASTPQLFNLQGRTMTSVISLAKIFFGSWMSTDDESEWALALSDFIKSKTSPPRSGAKRRASEDSDKSSKRSRPQDLTLPVSMLDPTLIQG